VTLGALETRHVKEVMLDFEQELFEYRLVTNDAFRNFD
jgi:hypothetical protein